MRLFGNAESKWYKGCHHVVVVGQWFPVHIPCVGISRIFASLCSQLAELSSPTSTRDGKVRFSPVL